MFDLVPTDKIFERLSVQADSAVSSAMESAAKGAFLRIEAILNTRLERASYVDTFTVEPKQYSAYNGLYRLKLGNGFVDPATVVITSGDVLFGAQGFTQWSQPKTPGEFFISSAKGFIDIPDNYGNRFVRVGYTAGFDPETDVDNIPDWLQEAAMAWTIKLLSTQQINEDSAPLTKIYDLLDKHSTDILDRHIRVSSRAIPALYTQVVETP